MKRHRRLISLVAILGLLMFVSALWFKQPALIATANLRTAVHQDLSFVSSTNSTFLAEVKSRIPGMGVGGAAFVVSAGIFAPRNFSITLVSHLKPNDCASRSLWLLNRSILI